MTVSKLPEPSDLKVLPLRALIAFAARCARRVQPAASRVSKEYSLALESAIETAERFARGEPVLGEEAEQIADKMVAETELFDTRADGSYSAGYAAAYAAKATSTAVFSKALPGVPDLGSGETADMMKEILDKLAGGSAREATLKHVSAAASAAGGAVHAQITRSTTWVDDPKAVVACEENANKIWRDFKKLTSMNLGKFPEFGAAVDSRPAGPLNGL